MDHLSNIEPGYNGEPMKEKFVPFPLRFFSKEKYLYVSRIAFFSSRSVNKTVDDLIFGRDWKEKNSELKAKQKKLGVSDATITSRRKHLLRRWRRKKSAG